MFRSFIAYIREFFRTPTYHDNLEAYIIAGKPQDSADVDRLEREFYNKRRQSITVFERYY